MNAKDRISIGKAAYSGWSAVWACSLLLMVLGGENAQNSEVGDPSGVYNLISVDGKDMPATVSHEGAKLDLRSGSITFNPDGTCLSKMVFVPPTGKEGTREVAATFTRKGSKLEMRWKGAGKTTGTLDGPTFTMNNEGMVLVYRK